MIWKPSSSHFRCYSFHLLLNTHTHTHKLSSVPFLSLFLFSYYWSSYLYLTPLPYSTLVMECLDAKINKLYNLWTTMGMPMDDISVTERLQVSFFIQYMDIRDSSSYISMYLQNWIDSWTMKIYDENYYVQTLKIEWLVKTLLNDDKQADIIGLGQHWRILQYPWCCPGKRSDIRTMQRRSLVWQPASFTASFRHWPDICQARSLNGIGFKINQCNYHHYIVYMR